MTTPPEDPTAKAVRFQKRRNRTTKPQGSTKPLTAEQVLAQGIPKTKRKKKSSGGSSSGIVRVPSLPKVTTQHWPWTLPNLPIGDQQFRLTGLRTTSGEQATLTLDNHLQQLEWTDENAVLSGTATLEEHDPFIRRLKLDHGDVLKCDVKWDNLWLELWRMRITDPDRTLSSGPNWPLYNDLYLLAESQDDFHFGTHKNHHPHGWFCHEIAQWISEHYHIPMGTIMRGTYRIKNLTLQGGNPVQLLARAYAVERQHSGRRAMLHWRNGKLDIVPLQRNDLLYVLRDQIIDATIGQERSSDYATALSVHAVKGHGKKKEKLHSLIQQADAVNRYGFIHKSVTIHGVDSEAELETRGKRMLAQRMKIKRTLTIEHEGIALIRRGDATFVDLPEEGFAGKKMLVWVSSAQHQVNNSGYTMHLELQFDDPLILTGDHRISDKAKRHKKRTKRKGKNGTTPKGSTKPLTAEQILAKGK